MPKPKTGQVHTASRFIVPLVTPPGGLYRAKARLLGLALFRAVKKQILFRPAFGHFCKEQNQHPSGPLTLFCGFVTILKPKSKPTQGPHHRGTYHKNARSYAVTLLFRKTCFCVNIVLRTTFWRHRSSNEVRTKEKT